MRKRSSAPFKEAENITQFQNTRAHDFFFFFNTLVEHGPISLF